MKCFRCQLEMPALAAPVGALAAAVGVARVVNGVHYPSDIAGGWVFGVGVGMLTLRWWPLRRSEPAAAARPPMRHPRRLMKGTRPRDELRRARPQMSCWSTVRTSQLENPGSVSLRDLLPTLSAFCPIRWSITSSDIAMRQPLADAWYRPGSTLGRPAVVVDYEFQ